MRGIERRRAYERRRPLMLKLRVVPKVGMSKAGMLDAIEASVRTGYLDPRISIRVADWAKATVSGRMNEGKLDPPLHRALADFWAAMQAARQGAGVSRIEFERGHRVRMERVD